MLPLLSFVLNERILAGHDSCGQLDWIDQAQRLCIVYLGGLVDLVLHQLGCWSTRHVVSW